MTPRPARVPTATYRLQFSAEFTFGHAERLVPYLHNLGVSHIYASPFLKARAGSRHGYDITDYDALNPEIGDEQDLTALAAALRRYNMGQILDFVPNHMGIGKADNRWWLDVLEWGRASPYADYFDIDWIPTKADLRGKVLLPFLGDHYGKILECGELCLAFDAAQGSFGVWYHEHLFPICPAHYGAILAPHLAELRAREGASPATLAILEDLAKRARLFRVSSLPIRRRLAVRDQALAFKRELAECVRDEPEVRGTIEEAVRRFHGTPGVPHSFLPLHRLLERQAYRLAYWRAAADEINYRRFFDINDLAGVKMEQAALFEVAHRLVRRLLADRTLHGLRIDHIDGLFDPAQYCQRLTGLATEALSSSPQKFAAGDANPNADGARAPIYIVVEKILARHESMRRDWPVDGTTGYENLNLINGLFVAQRAEMALDQVYRRFIGGSVDFDELLYDCKKHVMRSMLSSELQVLANDLDRISESNWRTRDFTQASLKAALEEVVACFPVYRTYVDEKGATAEDRRDIEWAVSLARRRSPEQESTIFDFVHAVLTTDLVRRRRAGYNRRAVLRFALKFQQFTGPVTAKALEDTSFYRFNRLLSANEVGGDPRRPSTSIGAFHHTNQERARSWPHAMIATATHDTKRGEDARARLNVLSELPIEWGRRVRHWANLNRRAKVKRDSGAAPGRNDEYFLYQTLVGAWPNELVDATDLDPERVATFRARVEATVTKAVREAKLNSSWTNPDKAYEEALIGFLRRILDPARSRAFLVDFITFEVRIAWFGMLNSLSQLLLKLTVPGVPDVYQGAEIWDYSMVDPDNRRSVDFDRRIALLADLRRRFADDAAPEPAVLRALLSDWTDGRIKLLVVSKLLRLRRNHVGLFQGGAYLPLTVVGAHAEHVCAFARVAGHQALIVAAPRLLDTLAAGRVQPPLGDMWSDTAVCCPAEFGSAQWMNVLSNEVMRAHEDGADWLLPASSLFAALPVAALVAGAPHQPTAAGG